MEEKDNNELNALMAKIYLEQKAEFQKIVESINDRLKLFDKKIDAFKIEKTYRIQTIPCCYNCNYCDQRNNYQTNHMDEWFCINWQRKVNLLGICNEHVVKIDEE